MASVTVGDRGRLIIPSSIREKAHIDEGTVVDVSVKDDGTVVLTPQLMIDRSQAWFWTQEWQKGERKASQEIDGGDTEVFEGEKEFQKALDKARGK